MLELMAFLQQNSFTDYADKSPEVPLLPRNSQNKNCEVYGCVTHTMWIEAIELGIKNFKFLPRREGCRPVGTSDRAMPRVSSDLEWQYQRVRQD